MRSSIFRTAWLVCHCAALRRNLLLFLFLLPQCVKAQLPAEPATIRIGVFSLFHPQSLTLTSEHRLTLMLDGSPHVLDAHRTATLRVSPSGVSVDSTSARSLQVPLGIFALAVPGKISRVYQGSLSVTSRSGVLVPVVTMETEVAVASIVAAEAPPNAPQEALKAQAIVSRSYLLANPRAHSGFDACDTTHCQFLRSPPAFDSPPAIATRATRHVVLTWRSSSNAAPAMVAAKYSRSCGGHTRVPPSASTAGSYPFYEVGCDFCRRHPELWSRANTPAFATEQERIEWNRAHGWSAVPSNTHEEVDGQLEGRGTGHGVGLCQLGAVDLAARGAKAEAILAHYFPNTTLTTLR